MALNDQAFTCEANSCLLCTMWSSHTLILLVSAMTGMTFISFWHWLKKYLSCINNKYIIFSNDFISPAIGGKWSQHEVPYKLGALMQGSSLTFYFAVFSILIRCFRPERALLARLACLLLKVMLNSRHASSTIHYRVLVAYVCRVHCVTSKQSTAQLIDRKIG